MPFLHIQTNQTVAAGDSETLLAEMSKSVAASLGKPERYVMVQISTDAKLMFAGNTTACAYVELKSIGLPEPQTQQLSKDICTLVEKLLKIPADRTYIEFTDAPRKFWGWNNSTF